MESKITSAESQFCVRGSGENLDCSCLSEDVLPSIPELPSFDCPTTTTTSDISDTTISTSEDKPTQTVSVPTDYSSVELPGINETQGCCSFGTFFLMVIIIIIVILLILIVIYIRYRKRSKLHAKYHTSSGNGPVASDINKVEEANGTKIQNSAEAVPLKSHNWVGSSPNSSKPNIPQSQSAEPLGPSDSASMVKTPSDPHLMVDEESQVQDLQTQPSQVELLTKDED